jgi:hypothetical protein
MADKAKFDVQEFFKANNLSFDGVNEDGSLRAISGDGKTARFVPEEFLASKGIKGAEITVNTPDQPVEISPIGVLERAALVGAGNEKGKLKYLKSRFQDVRYDEQGGLVVKDKNVWRSVDPAGLGGGDAWEMSKELAKDIADLSDVALTTAGGIVGAAKGAALGLAAGPAGGIVGGIIGAGTGSAVARAGATILGKLAGTYEATPEEVGKELAFEFAAASVGQGLATGVKPTAQWLKGVVKGINKIPAGAKDIAEEIVAKESQGLIKQALVETLGKTTAGGARSVEVMFENPDEVAGLISRYSAKARGSVAKRPELIAQDQLKIFQEGILEPARKKLSTKYGEALKALESGVDDSFKANIQADTLPAFEELVNEGFLRRVTSKNGSFSYLPLDEKAAAELTNRGIKPNLPNSTAQAALSAELKSVQTMLSNLKPTQGVAAARQVMAAKAGLNEKLGGLIEVAQSSGDATSARIYSAIKSRLSDATTKPFQASEKLAQLHEATVGVYRDYGEAVKIADKTLRSETGVQTMLNAIMMKNTGALPPAGKKETVAALRELLGGSADGAISQVEKLESAKVFSSLVPLSGFNMGGAAAGIGASFATGNPLAAAAIGIAASPQAILKATQATRFMKTLPPASLQALQRNPEALRTLLRTMANSSQEEAELQAQFEQQALGQ